MLNPDLLAANLFRWGIDRPASTAGRWSSELLCTPPLDLLIGDERLVYSWMLREMCLGNLKQSPDNPGSWLYRLPFELQRESGAQEYRWEYERQTLSQR
ncbi:hypothetical protein [Acaryochloris thomasi]|uniref:hypothetical protein n=1 Tax=Acaryochloris thomasi TaxID=2929456 RepID=UPI0011B63F72|nr:hypothetical protein [Acaryochloris thomasi]